MNKTVPLRGFGGGGESLNFNVVGGTSVPTNPKENTIWVNTDQKITSWHLGADEPNVYDIQLLDSYYWWELSAPHPLREGDILNFTIPITVPDQLEAIRLQDSNGKEYYFRDGSGSAVAAWPAGTKVGVRISNDLWPIKSWAGQGTAYLMAWGSYYHEEGTVWITTGVSSNVAFNALKKNGLKVYPISAKHYRSGAWVEKPAKIYQGGEWVDWWDGSLYKIGNQYTEITGGWIPRGVSSLGTMYTPTAPTIVFGESGMHISVNSEVASGVSECKNDIDLSTHNVLTVNVSGITFVSGVSDIQIWVAKRNALSEVKGVASAVAATTGTIRTAGVYMIDVSTLNGMYDIAIWVSTTNGSYTDITITDVTLS